MKFYKYINERTKIEDYPTFIKEIERVKETLKKRCMPFLKEFDAPIYRGYNKGISGLMSRKVARKDRKPRFIPQKVHEELDKVLYSMYGWYPRTNGVFTANSQRAMDFGNVYMFFPVGKYQYIWTERVDDLYDLYDGLTFLAKKGQDDSSNFEKKKEKLINLLKSGIYNTNRLNQVVVDDLSYEAIFNCESFYLLDLKLHDEMMDWMQEI